MRDISFTIPDLLLMLLKLMLFICAPLGEPAEFSRPVLKANPPRPVEGSSVTLICEIRLPLWGSHKQLEFCFFRNYQPLGSSCSSSPELWIATMWKEDTGFYWCEAKVGVLRNPRRSLMFQIHVQRVPVSDVSLETQPPGGWVTEGDKLVLICLVANGTGDITFFWYKGALSVTLETKTQRSQTAQYEILTVRESDAELYFCAADNGYGPSLSGLVPIRVKNVVVWSSLVQSGGGASFNFSLSAEHSGKYSCEADNGPGAQRSEVVTLNITVPVEGRMDHFPSGVIEGMLGSLGPITVALLFCYWLKRKIGRRSGDPVRSPSSPVPQEASYLNSPAPRQLEPIYENVNIVSGDEVYSLVDQIQQEREPATGEYPRTHVDIYSRLRKANVVDVDYDDAM
ncbi:Fc receptor-like protein 1 isoform X2 [Dipodomys spectabilis]|uniref:Fc receptor-like protein 1 isoform X2 n=1 Tax=Dipodomys spectabilis TaxID=105255 RepID=UPI001C549459|nr:Fc receptor-like protein 1 isoform X2 [Dipodomys spectabilis]